MQYIATNAIREESPIVQATGGVGIGMVAHGLTQSDCRSLDDFTEANSIL